MPLSVLDQAFGHTPPPNPATLQEDLESFLRPYAERARRPLDVLDQAFGTNPLDSASRDAQQRFPGVNPGLTRQVFDRIRNPPAPTPAPEQVDAGEGVTEYLGRRSLPFWSTEHNVVASKMYERAKKEVEAGRGNDTFQDTGLSSVLRGNSSVWEAIVRNVQNPIESVLRNVQPVTEAVRLAQGNVTNAQMVSHYEQLQSRDANRGWLGGSISAVAHLPSIAGEMAIGGAVAKPLLGAAGVGPSLGVRGSIAAAREGVMPAISTLGGAAARNAATTALAPSMWADQMVQDNLRNNRSPTDPLGIAPGFAMGMLNVAVLGSLGAAGNAITKQGVSGAALRALTRTITGMAEQSLIVDPLASAVSEILPEAWKLQTGYGLVGHLVNHGDDKDFWKHAIVQAVTFGAFSVLHGVHDGKTAAKENVKRVLDEAKANGLSAEQAREELVSTALRNGMIEQAKTLPEGDPERANIIREYDIKPEELVVRYGPYEQRGAEQRQELPSLPQGQPEGVSTQGGGMPRPGMGVVPEGPPRPPQAQIPIEQPQNAGTVANQVVSARPEQAPMVEQMTPESPQGAGSRGTVAPEPSREVDLASAFDPESVRRAVARQEGAPNVRVTGGTTNPMPEVSPEPRRLGAVPKPEVVPAAESRTKEPFAFEAKPSTVERQALISIAEQLGTVKGGSWQKIQEGIQRHPEGQALLNDIHSRADIFARVRGMDAAEGRTETPAEIVKALNNTDGLHPSERAALENAVSGIHLRDIEKIRDDNGQPVVTRIGDGKGAGYETVRTYAERAYQKMREANPGEFDAYPFLNDYIVERGLTRGRAYLANNEMRPATVDHGLAILRSLETSLAEIELVQQKTIKEATQHGYSAEKVQGDIERATPEELADRKRQRGFGQAPRAVEAPAVPEASKPTGLGGVEPAEGRIVRGPKRKGELYNPLPDIARFLGLTNEPSKPAAEVTPETRATNDVAVNREIDDGIARGRVLRGPGAKPGRRGEVSNPFSGIDGEKLAKPFKAALGRWNAFTDNLAGVAMARTGQLSELAANAGARLASAAEAARSGAAYFIDKVMGPNINDAEKSLYGAASVEWRLRATRDGWAKKYSELWDKADAHSAEAKRYLQNKAATTDAEEAKVYGSKAAQEGALAAKARADAVEAKIRRDNVKSVFTQDDSPIKSEADYQRIMADPRMKEIVKKWNEPGGMKDIMEEMFNQAKGHDIHDAIDSFTQNPEMVLNLLAKGEEGKEYIGGMSGHGRGNLTNVKARKSPFDSIAKGDATNGYELDLGKIIENSLHRGLAAATKAELYRTYEKEKIGQWAKPGESPGEGWKKIPDVRPGEGTQAAKKGETDFWVVEQAYNETRRVLATDQPWGKIPGADILNTYSLTSFGDDAANLKNILSIGMNLHPIFGPIDFVKNITKVWKKSPETLKNIWEAARAGEMKPAGPESGILSSMLPEGLTKAIDQRLPQGWETRHLDPTYYTSKVFDVINTTMRLTGKDAFARLERGESWLGIEIKGGEFNERNFVNQLGLYEKRLQNSTVAWLRDTGFGPFATMGSNQAVQGIRAVTGNSGLVGKTGLDTVKLRAAKIAKIAAVFSLGAIINFKLWGNIFGDDDTPIGAIKTGEANGKTTYFDLGGFTGFTRGAKLIGLHALLEGYARPAFEGRRPDSAGEIVQRGLGQAASGVVNPILGPVGAFAHTAVSGRNNAGMLVSEQVERGSGEVQFFNNLRAAFFGLNQFVENSATLASQAAGGEGFDGKRNIGGLERIAKMTGAESFGALRHGADPVATFRREMRELHDQKEYATRHGQPFEREAEYRALRAYERHIQREEDQLQGLAGSPRRLGERPDQQLRTEIRQRQMELARDALQTFREIRRGR